MGEKMIYCEKTIYCGDTPINLSPRKRKDREIQALVKNLAEKQMQEKMLKTQLSAIERRLNKLLKEWFKENPITETAICAYKPCSKEFTRKLKTCGRLKITCSDSCRTLKARNRRR
jgi:hypothetical protein